MSDGAQLGYTAEQSLSLVLGGHASEFPQPMTAEEMCVWIDTAPDDDHTYDGQSRYAAKLIVDYLRAHPHTSKLDAMTLSLEMRADGVSLDELDLSGFMFGWAINAARRCVELPEIANPAIIEPKQGQPKGMVIYDLRAGPTNPVARCSVDDSERSDSQN